MLDGALVKDDEGTITVCNTQVLNRSKEGRQSDRTSSAVSCSEDRVLGFGAPAVLRENIAALSLASEGLVTSDDHHATTARARHSSSCQR